MEFLGEDGLEQDRGVSRSSGRLGAIQEAGGDPGWGGFGGGVDSWVTGSAGPGDPDFVCRLVKLRGWGMEGVGNLPPSNCV